MCYVFPNLNVSYYLLWSLTTFIFISLKLQRVPLILAFPDSENNPIHTFRNPWSSHKAETVLVVFGFLVAW